LINLQAFRPDNDERWFYIRNFDQKNTVCHQSEKESSCSPFVRSPGRRVNQWLAEVNADCPSANRGGICTDVIWILSMLFSVYCPCSSTSFVLRISNENHPQLLEGLLKGDLLYMKKGLKRAGTGFVALLMLLLAACGSADKTATTKVNNSAGNVVPAGNTAEQTTRTVRYLDKDYSVPAKVERIVITGSLEAMEDAVVLGVQPVGGITIGGKFPDIFKEITGSTVSIGEKTQPNFETILQLKPDVILGTSKFKPEVMEKLVKIAPTFPYSHISTNWENNLRLLAELTGKQDLAEQALEKYKADAEAAKAQLGEKLKGKKVVVIRYRQGNINIYPENVYFNDTLYKDLGLEVPEPIKAAKAQETISLERFSEMNPDYVFVQFSLDENAQHPKALEEVQANPIWQSINAVKNNRVYVNVVDPLAQGGTAWSKINFLKAAVEKLSQ
jgi:iron complex transport system substrate-binding protein